MGPALQRQESPKTAVRMPTRKCLSSTRSMVTILSDPPHHILTTQIVSKITTEKRQSIITIAPPIYRSTMPQDFDPKLHHQSRTQTSQSEPAPYHSFRRMKIDSGIVINGNVYGKSKNKFRSWIRRAGKSGNLYSDIETFSGGRVINGDVFDSPGLWK